MNKFKKLLSFALIAPMLGFIGIFLVAPAVQAEPLTCNMQTYSGEDDVAHQMSLPFNLFLGGVDHNQVFLTTNATMTFGSPDANYWSYPSTPSVSLAGWDWVTWGQGAYVSYGYNSNSFCIEWSVRPFPQSGGDLTQIRLMVNRFNNGNWHGEITTFGWLPNDLRRGIVSQQNGQPLVIAAAFDVIRGVPIEVEPAPTPTSFDAPPQVNCWDGSQADSMDLCPVEPVVTCWDGSIVHYQSECSIPPTPITCWDGSVVYGNDLCPNSPPPIECWDGSSVNWDAQCPQEPADIICWDGSIINWNEVCPVEPSPVPTQTIEPTPTIEPSPQPSEPSPQPSQEPSVPSTSPTPSADPSESQSQLPIPVLTQSPDPVQPSLSPSQEALTPVQSPTPDPSPSSTDLPSNNNIIGEMVILENGVVLEASVAEALELFESPTELITAIFTDPAMAFKALANVGADMTPEKRHESQQITISVIIYAQIMNGLSAANMLMRRS